MASAANSKLQSPGIPRGQFRPDVFYAGRGMNQRNGDACCEFTVSRKASGAVHGNILQANLRCWSGLPGMVAPIRVAQSSCEPPGRRNGDSLQSWGASSRFTVGRHSPGAAVASTNFALHVNREGFLVAAQTRTGSFRTPVLIHASRDLGLHSLVDAHAEYWQAFCVLDSRRQRCIVLAGLG